MCNNNPVSIENRISRPYERFRKSVFNLSRPISLSDLSPEMVTDREYLEKMGLPCSDLNCNNDKCLILRGIFEELDLS